MSTFLKEYRQIGDTNEYIRFSLSFNKSLSNWATNEPRKMGYMVNATPIKRKQADRFVIEEFTAYQGFNEVIYPVERQSQKRLAEAKKLMEHHINNKYKEFFKAKGYEYK